MQMQSVQSITERREFCGLVDGVLLTGRSHPTDETWAKQMLLVLHRAVPSMSWELEIQSGSILFWCGLHPTFGYRMTAAQLNKGYSILARKGQELVERIKAGAC